VPICDIAKQLDYSSPSEVVHALCLARDAGKIAQFAMIDPAIFLCSKVEDLNARREGLAQALYGKVQSLELAAVAKLHAVHHAMKLGLESTNKMEEFITAYLHSEQHNVGPIVFQPLEPAGRILVRHVFVPLYIFFIG